MSQEAAPQVDMSTSLWWFSYPVLYLTHCQQVIVCLTILLFLIYYPPISSKTRVHVSYWFKRWSKKIRAIDKQNKGKRAHKEQIWIARSHSGCVSSWMTRCLSHCWSQVVLTGLILGQYHTDD